MNYHLLRDGLSFSLAPFGTKIIKRSFPLLETLALNTATSPPKQATGGSCNSPL